jgi:hypothetical protein
VAEFGVNTTRTFKAKRNQLIVEFLGVLGAGVVLVFWKGAAVTPFLVVFLVGFLVYRLLLNGIAIKTVILRSDGVEIVPLFPWLKPRRWNSDQLASYKSGALSGRVKSRPFVGFLMPKVGKTEMLWASGTERFSELDELLSNLLPPPEEQMVADREGEAKLEDTEPSGSRQGRDRVSLEE